MRGVGLELAGDPVVEAHAEGEQQVGALDGGVDVGLAVHAHHAEAERVAGWEAAQAQQGERDRDVGLVDELPQQLAGAGLEHAVAGQDQRPLGARD